jgi:hypothetical protein
MIRLESNRRFDLVFVALLAGVDHRAAKTLVLEPAIPGTGFSGDRNS